MRLACILLSLAIITICSCRKKDNVTPAPIISKPKITDTIPVVTYPYTDTFIGKYTDQSFDDGYTSEPAAIDSNVLFYVQHLNADTMVFIADSIRDYEYGAAITVKDTFTFSAYGIYQLPYTQRKYQTTADCFTYYGGAYFTFTWSYNSRSGCPGEIIDNCSYSGTKITP